MALVKCPTADYLAMPSHCLCFDSLHQGMLGSAPEMQVRLRVLTFWPPFSCTQGATGDGLVHSTAKCIALNLCVWQSLQPSTCLGSGHDSFGSWALDTTCGELALFDLLWKTRGEASWDEVVMSLAQNPYLNTVLPWEAGCD